MESIPAYFLTWTTYGTWLPGDDRGWVSRLNNAQGADVCQPSPRYEDLCRSRMTSDAVVFNNDQRAIVEEAIREQCDFRGWHLFAANCRTNHVHVLLQAMELSPSTVMHHLKSYATRALRKKGFFVGKSIWTTHGSMRRLDKSENIYNVIGYIEGQ